MNKSEIYAALRKKYLTEDATGETLEAFSDIFHTACKTIEHFETHERIMVSVSGGSDSDCMVHFFCTYFPEYLYKIHFVFSDTGIEYSATRNHLAELENKYNIQIERVRGESVVTSVRKYGVPMLNKSKSKALSMYLRKTPKGHFLVFENDSKYFGFTDKERQLAKYCEKNKIMVSEKCCEVSKKKPMQQFAKQHKIDLIVTGERKAEGGLRATIHKSCFEEHKHGGHKFMPLFWWNDTTKKIFKETEKIHYSDCYEVWGMKRTGCVGCPFGKDTAGELKLMKQYEPKLYALCRKVFGTAYETMDKFQVRKKPCLPENVKE